MTYLKLRETHVKFNHEPLLSLGVIFTKLVGYDIYDHISNRQIQTASLSSIYMTNEIIWMEKSTN